MEVSNRTKWIVGLVLALVLALSTYLGVNNPQPVVVDTPVFEQTRGGAVQVNKLVVQDALTVGGAFTAAGATTQTGVFAANGGLTVGGGYGSTGCTLSDAGVLQCNGAATTDGALTAASAVIGGGYGSTGCTLSAAGVLQCDGAATFAGGITDVVPVLTKDANYQITSGDTGSIIKNTSIVSATFTLPSAAAGLNYCFYNYSGSDVVINPIDGADTILKLTNAPGDQVTNTTQFDSVCLVALDTTNWANLETGIGTWVDGN